MAISLRSLSIPPGSSTKAQGPPALLPLMPGCATQAEFHTTLYLEQRRSERSGRPFLLILLNAQAIGEAGMRAAMFAAILATLRGSVRETDKLGWYTTASVLGLLFRDVGSAGPGLVHDLVNKVSAAVTSAVHAPAADAVQLTACLFPQPADKAAESSNLSSCSRGAERGVQSALKRAMDIAGSLLGLLLLSPLFLLIAAAVKCSSPGPAIFRQQRVGQSGTVFTFLKFRSMYLSCDPLPHQDYVQAFIADRGAPQNGIYKLTCDTRVTSLGRILRKTSLDELPQFWNVLRGEMSLVGPRPPLPYEFKNYAPWHRRRVLEAKPGMTGLWQVSGRSRTTFDEMVRLDLRYARQKSFWLDLKILLRTPQAVLSGKGAY